MRIHTNLCRGMIDIAAKEAGVTFERYTLHGSRSRDHAFDVILSGNSGRRANMGGDYEAASWDQWGIFLGRIFKDDPTALCWAYKDADDFHWKTGERFNTLTLKDATRFHKWSLGEYDGYSSTSHCTHNGCTAIRRWEGMTMEMRTRIQENKYGQALGYAWGRKDGTSDTFALCADTMAFAAWYALKEEREDGRSLQRAFDAFITHTQAEQKQLGRESERRPWSMYEEMMKERQGMNG